HQSLYAKGEMKNGKNVNIALSEKDVHNGHLYKKAKVKIHSNDNYQLISEKPKTSMGEKDRANDTKHQIYQLNKHTKLIKQKVKEMIRNKSMEDNFEDVDIKNRTIVGIDVGTTNFFNCADEFLNEVFSYKSDKLPKLVKYYNDM